MLTEKYLAGFIDADGYIGIYAQIRGRPRCEVQLAQRELYREPVDDLHTMFGGTIRLREIDGGIYVSTDLRGSDAVKVLERLAKYAVIKGPWMRAALEIVRDAPVLHTIEEVAAFRQAWKQAKRAVSHTERNYPSRKWLAGYFDGDGTLIAPVENKTGYAYPVAKIMSEPHMAVGIHLIQKAFGGIIRPSGKNLLWQLALSQPSKINEFIGFIADDLVVKRAQAYYLLNLAKGGNLRDGETIRTHMQGLNAQQHRLSDSAGHAVELARTVNFDIPTLWVRRSRPEAIVETTA